MNTHTILITGGAGFVGSHLTKRLVAKKVRPHLLIQSTTDLYRLAEIQDDITLHTADITNASQVTLLIQKIKPEVVFHLAAAGVQYGDQDVDQLLATNIKGTDILMRSLSETDCKKVIHTGSCFEYDGQSRKPYDEQTPAWSTNLYGISKVAANRVVRMRAVEMNMPSITIRPFGLYGEYEQEQRLIPSLIHACLSQKLLELTPGKQIRDYLYVEDLIDAFLQCADYKQKNVYEEFNIGSGSGIALRELSDHIVSLTKADPSLLQFGALPYRKGEMMHLVADSSRAQKNLRWEPKTDLRTGLKQTINWFTQQV